MSDTTTSPPSKPDAASPSQPAPADQGIPPEPAWAKPGIAVFTLLLFVVAYTVAYLSKDDRSLLLMTGAVIAMAQQVVGYFFGSSSGSTAKSAILAQKPKEPSNGN